MAASRCHGRSGTASRRGARANRIQKRDEREPDARRRACPLSVSQFIVLLRFPKKSRHYVAGSALCKNGTGGPPPRTKKTAGARRKAPAGLVRGNPDLSAGPKA